MKKLFIASLLLGSASLAHADYKLVNTDGSSLTSLCIAAAESPANTVSLARSQGILPDELDSVRCNGMPLKRFVLKYGKTEHVEITGAPTAEASGYLLRKSDSSPLTELCAAAAISDQELAKVKEQHFSDDERIESEVLCNGVRLKSFARKFRNAEVRLLGLR